MRRNQSPQPTADQAHEMIVYVTETNGIDWREAAMVIHRAPLGSRVRDPDQLKRAFEASYSAVFAFDSGRLVGMARALCDGQYQAAIYDVVLLPEYQGRGIGKGMMRRLRDQLPAENVILYAVPGKEGFYEKCGFRKLRTGMAVLSPEASDPARGYIE